MENECTQVCNTLNNRIDFIKGMIDMPENIGIKGITRAEHYIESLEHLKSELEDNKTCKCSYEEDKGEK